MKWHWLAFAILMGLLGFYSVYHLTESPPIWYDEGIYTQVAMNMAEHGVQSIQLAPDSFAPTSYVTVGYPVLLPVAISYKLFGVGVWQGRAVMAIFLLGLGLMTYVLMRRLFDSHTALLSLMLMATLPILFGNGKTVIGEVPGLFFLMSCLYSLWYLESTNFKDWRGYVAVGLTAGLCIATKPIFILLLPALLLVYLLRFKRISLTLPGVLAGVIAFIIPTAVWVYLQFGVDASVQSIIAMYANPSGVENMSALMRENALRFFKESTPIYTAFLVVVWAAALFLRRKSKSIQKNISAAELVAFFYSILILLAYLRMAGGWYRYLLPAMVVALPFLPQSCITLFEWFKQKAPVLARVAWFPMAFIFLLALGQAYQTAHSSFVAESYGSTKTRDLTAAISAINPQSSVFLYNAPDAAVFLQSRNYYQYLMLSASVTLGADQLPLLVSGTPDVVIISSSDYQKHPELFARYQSTQTVGGFNILAKTK